MSLNNFHFFFCIVFAVAYVAIGGARADFLKTGPAVYQSSDRTSRVIVTESLPGLFVVTGAPIDLQEFTPGNLKAHDSLALFIRIDPTTRRYTSISIGNRSYRLKAFARLRLGALRITVDNTNPYISILGGIETKNPSVLAFSGSSEVVNASGESVVALLEANQLNQYRELIKSFEVTSDGLTLEGQFFGGDSVGLDLEIQNPCLETQALLVSEDSLTKVRAAVTAQEQRQLLKSVLKQSSRAAKLPSTIRLSVDRGSVLFFDYKLFRLIVARKSDELSTPRVPVCITYPFREENPLR